MAEEKVRLLVCQDCKTIEELPDHDGPVDYDVLLETAASRHETASGLRHVGFLYDVSAKSWNDSRIRLEIIEQIKKRSGEGLGNAFYAVKATFQEDAQKCWRQHNRTRNCDEYKSDRKRLQPDTKAERKDLGLAPMQSDRFLCEFCPVQSVMMQRMRADRGDYNYTS
ncbi:hypothetical protein [Nonomuraea typhae]|uniref:Uncharacterized protein n=1 Tax=Nonomuraea typhae TaxID=2603600 RepID=A0ABW7YK22_9ACTN